MQYEMLYYCSIFSSTLRKGMTDMFNFLNLNDYEFELLCKDILEVELGERLRTYSKGRDGGIDISCYGYFDGCAIIIAQAKHYINSTYPNLLSSLNRELTKLKQLQPKNYYIFTSLSLTPANVKEIYNLFKDYMSSAENIYDGVRIDRFLSKESSLDIVNRNYKVWLTSSNVLDLVCNRNVFIDTEEFMFDINKEIKLFVETVAYYDAIKIIDKRKTLIIVGDPGVGKTTISKMLLLYYSNKGYSVRYVSDRSIKDIKKSLSIDASKKEIILIDDFLGQHYLNLKDNQPSEIKSLISYILGSQYER
jgi:hypothetical protein